METLRNAVDFTFPPGTTMSPGASVVIAKDARRARREISRTEHTHPRKFLGSLSNSSDRIELKDANGNPADETRYYTGGAWPETPDGGGASLELRDVRADNTNGGAWAASDRRRARAGRM